MMKSIHKITSLILSVSLAAGLCLNASATTDITRTGENGTVIGSSGQADSESFRIDSITAKYNPSKLTAKGGSVTYTVKGSHLEKKEIYIRILKDNAPYLVVHANEIPNLFQKVGSTLFSGSVNVTEKSTDSVRIEKGSENAYTVYNVAVMSTSSNTAPDSTDSGWVSYPDLTVTLDKLGSTTVGSSNKPSSSSSSVPSSSSSSSSEEESSGDESESSSSSSESSSSQESSSSGDESSKPAEPEPVYAKIRDVYTTTMPDPLTASGGGFVVSVAGSNLNEDKVTVWVRIVSGTGETQILQAEGGRELVNAPRFDVPANTTGEDIRYAVAAMTKVGRGRPGADDPAWQEYPGANVIVPSKKSDELQGGGAARIDSVQAITVPSPITYQGGQVTVAVTGAGLDTVKLYAMLSGGDDAKVRRVQMVSPESALTDAFTLKANESKTKDQKYKIKLLQTDKKQTGAPSENDPGWKSYGEVVVPCIAEHKVPEIDKVTWRQTGGGGSSSLVFDVQGRNFDNEDNSIWIKASPRDGDKAKILPADVGRTYAAVSTEPMEVKSSADSGDVVYDIYAMTKVGGKKPSAEDQGWKKFGNTGKINEQGEPKVFGASADVVSLPNEGGLVHVTVSGEHLNLLEKRDFFVRLERVTPDGVEKVADENIDENNMATFLIEANDSQTQGVSYRYSTMLKTVQQVWGEIPVAAQMRFTTETFSAGGDKIPSFTWEGGKLRVSMQGSVPESSSVWIKAAYRAVQNGLPDKTQNQIVKMTELDGSYYTDFINIEPNTAGVAHDVSVYAVTLPVSAPEPQADDSRWSGPVATVSRPASSSGEPSIATGILAVPEDGKITPAPTGVKVTIEGENLGDNVFVTLSTTDGSAPDITQKADGGSEKISAGFTLPANESAKNRRYYVSSYATVNGEEDGPNDSSYTVAYDSVSFIQPAYLAAAGKAAPIDSSVLDGTIDVQIEGGSLSSSGGKVRFVSNDNSEYLNYNVVIELRSIQDDTHSKQVVMAKGQTETAVVTIPENTLSEEESYRVFAALSDTAVVDDPSILDWIPISGLSVPAASLAQIDSLTAELPTESDGELSPTWQRGGGGEITAVINGRNLRDRTVYIKYGYADSVTQENTTGTLKSALVTTDDATLISFDIPANTTDQPILYVIYACVAKDDIVFAWQPDSYDVVTGPVYIRQPARAKHYEVVSISGDGGDSGDPNGLTLGYSGSEQTIKLQLTGSDLRNCAVKVNDVVQQVNTAIGSEGSASFTLPRNTGSTPNVYDIWLGDTAYDPPSWVRSGYSVTVLPQSSNTEPRITSAVINDENARKGGTVFVRNITVSIQGVNLGGSTVSLRTLYNGGLNEYPYYFTVPASGLVQANLVLAERGPVTVEIGLEDSSGNVNYAYLASFTVADAPTPSTQGFKANSSVIKDDVTRVVSVTVTGVYDIANEEGYYIRAQKGSKTIGPAPMENFINSRDPQSEINIDTATGSLMFSVMDDSGTIELGEYTLEISSDGADTFNPIQDAGGSGSATITVIAAEAEEIPDDGEGDGDGDDSSNSDSSGSDSSGSSDDSSNSSGSSSDNSSSGSSSGTSSDSGGIWGKDMTHLTGEDYIKAKDNADKKGYGSIRFDIGSELVIDKSFFQKAEDSKYDIYLEAADYTWFIPSGSTMEKSLKGSYNLTVLMNSRYEDDMQDIAGSKADIFPFRIIYSGTLPTRMKLTIETDFYRENVWVYRYNEDDDDVTYIAEDSVNSNGEVEFYLRSCSHYFISDRRVGSARYDSSYRDYPFTDKESLDLGGGVDSRKNNPSTGQRD